MSNARRDRDRARQEAARWWTRLRRRAVTTQEIRDFRAWRRDPQNRAALEEVEGVWDTSGWLANDPDVQSVRAEVLRRTQRRARPRPRRTWILAAGAGAFALACGAVFFASGGLSPAYTTAVGEMRVLRLSDGSTLRLNTNSRAVVKFGERQRTIDLVRGEALFDVAHDPTRPFVVRAAKSEVRALGTVFDVQVSPGGAAVTLLEGAVEVRAPGGGALTLRPNQQVRVQEGVLTPARPANAPRATSWTERRLIFESTPLGEAIAEVNRYSAGQIDLQTADLANAPVNGVFETGDTQAFASAVSSVFDLQMARRGDDVILRRPPGREKNLIAR